MDSHKYFDNFTLLYIIYAAVILLVIWLLLREVMNWYWKHNQMLSLMQERSKCRSSCRANYRAYAGALDS